MREQGRQGPPLLCRKRGRRSCPTAPGGFWPITEDYVGHLVAELPETLPFMARDALGVTAAGTRFDTVIEGRRSYELGLAAGITNAYPHLRHLVCPTTLTSSPDPSVELVSGDPVDAVRDLRSQQGSGIWLVGGGGLADHTVLPGGACFLTCTRAATER